MPRLSILLALLVLVVSATASAADGRTTRGQVVAVTPKGIAVKDAKGIVTRCALADRSPSVDGYARGDRVQIFCVEARGHLVLVKVRKVETPATPANDTEPVTFGGTVTHLVDGSITVHDGDRDLTCKLGDTSPALGDVKVGTHVKIACVNGVLARLAVVTLPPVPPVPPAPAPEAVTFGGTVTAVTDGSITLHDGDRDFTCKRGPSSPALGDVTVGSHAKVACVSGVLTRIELVTVTPPPPPPPTTAPTTGAGLISVLTDGSITVHNGEHNTDLTCRLGNTSPALGEFHVGDHVGIACTDGVLVKIARIV